MGHTFLSLPSTPSCLDPWRGWQCQGVGSPVSGSNNRFIVMILFVFPVFCLTWQPGRERAAGSLWFVLGGSCSHTQALKPEACTGMPSPGGPLSAEARCGKYFLFVGQPGVAGISPIPVLLTSPRSRSKGRLRRPPVTLGSGTRGPLIMSIGAGLH